jgi:hypothetical protein
MSLGWVDMTGVDPLHTLPAYVLTRTSAWIWNYNLNKESMYELQKLSNNYNFNISTTSTKVMALQGKYPSRSKIILNNKSIIEQVSSFSYLGCNVTYNMMKIEMIN